MFSPPIFFLHFESCLTRNGFCHLQAYNNFVEISLSPTKQTPTLRKREEKKSSTQVVYTRKIAILAFDYRLIVTIYENSMTKVFSKQWAASLSLSLCLLFCLHIPRPITYVSANCQSWGHKYIVFTVQKTKRDRYLYESVCLPNRLCGFLKLPHHSILETNDFLNL